MALPAVLVNPLVKSGVKGILFLIIIGGAYVGGKWNAEAECEANDLRAQLAEIVRQKAATDIILKRAEETRIERDRQIEGLQTQVKDYADFLKHQQKHSGVLRCSIDANDVDRLRNIR